MQKETFVHLWYWLFKAKSSGLNKVKLDPRNFKTGIFNWGVYAPKAQREISEPTWIKNQGSKNTCQWNATASQKERDEEQELNVRSIVGWGVKKGLVSGNGFSNLEDGQKALKDWGILEKSIIPEDLNNWSDYSNVDIERFATLAEIHKASSYWQVSSRNDILRLLDEGHTMTTGIDWFTGFNQGGGFSSPWIIFKPIGYKVGGHAVLLIGYDLNYKSYKVYVFQNSYGESWGDNGKFYITMDYFDRNNYGVFTNLDMPSIIGDFLNKYDGKNVKGSGSTIYHIQNGLKKPYLHEMDYFVWNINDPTMKNFEIVDNLTLNKVPQGDSMDITKSDYWEILKHLEQPLNITRVIEAIKQSKS